MKDCIFCKIIRGDLPSYTIYEDETIKVIMNINPITDGHLLVLPKEHYVDARCISKNPTAIPMNFIYTFKKVRRHNRQIHKFVPNKKGIRQNNQAPFEVRGYRLFDVIKYNNKICYISGRRQSGYFTLKTLNDSNEIETLTNVSYKKLNFIRHTQNFIILQKPILINI